jgi:hypothetical protein
MAICVAGFHRAGTSMVARLLERSGVYLGPEEELLTPAPDNPEGFWEHREFLHVNDELLDRLGGAWDVVPAFPERWWERRELDDLRARAGALARRFGRHDVWGWKDPRNSLTLPFWRSVVPDLRVVVCVRNPLEIARSFARRGYSSPRFSLELWAAYTDALLAAVELEDCVVTHYDSYFHNPESELRRVVAALQIDASESVLRRAREHAVVPHLRRSHLRADDPRDLPPGVAARYERLTGESGPVFEASRQTGVGGEEPAAASVHDPLDVVPAEAREVVDKLLVEVAMLNRELSLLRGSRAYRYTSGARRMRDLLRRSPAAEERGELARADATSSP